jgi:hypothetical protein
MKKVLLEIIQDPKAAAAIGAALLALIGGVLGPLVQLIIGSKQASTAQRAVDVSGSRAIAPMRLAWMDKLRDTLSEYHSILMIKKNVDQENLAQKLSLLGTQLDLLLNQNDKAQKVLWGVTDKIYNSETRTTKLRSRVSQSGPCSAQSGVGESES